MELHKKTTPIEMKCPFRGFFHYAEITPESENYGSQFNYYFRILWGSAVVDKDFERKIKRFMILRSASANATALVFVFNKINFAVNLGNVPITGLVSLDGMFGHSRVRHNTKCIIVPRHDEELAFKLFGD